MVREQTFFDALWLTALRWEDADLSCVAQTLPERWRALANERGARLTQLTGGDKAREMRRIVASLGGEIPSDARMPARALSLLCSEVDRETGRRWASAAEAPRRGYVADVALRRWLGRLARRCDA